MFTVSCPNDKTTVSVKYDVTQTATVGVATEVSFVLETNSEFTEKAKETSSVVVDASAFNASDTDKATATVSEITLSDDKKEATVKFSLTAKKDIVGGELKITIPQVSTEADEIVKGVKEKVTINGKNTVKVTVTKANATVSVKTAVSDNVTVGTAKEITVVLATNSKFTEKAKETSSVVIDASAFNASDTDKATATVSEITLSDDKKEATVKFSLTAKKAVVDGTLIFTIPEVDSKANEIVENAQDEIRVGGESVKITATEKITVSIKGGDVSVFAIVGKTTTFTVTLVANREFNKVNNDILGAIDVSAFNSGSQIASCSLVASNFGSDNKEAILKFNFIGYKAETDDKILTFEAPLNLSLKAVGSESEAIIKGTIEAIPIEGQIKIINQPIAVEKEDFSISKAELIAALKADTGVGDWTVTINHATWNSTAPMGTYFLPPNIVHNIVGLGDMDGNEFTIATDSLNKFTIKLNPWTYTEEEVASGDYTIRILPSLEGNLIQPDEGYSKPTNIDNMEFKLILKITE